MNDSLVYLTLKFLKLNTIYIDSMELAFQIQSHPSYPSLHAITGVLDHFNIDNVALDIPKNEETLTQLPKTFLAQIETENGKEFAIIEKNGLHYNLTFSEKKKSKLSLNEFLKQFTGIIVAVEKTEQTEEKKNTNKLFNNSLIAVCSLITLSVFLYNKPSLTLALFLIANVAGILISITLKKQEKGESTILGNAFCSGASELKDCDAVLASKGANVFGNFKLSDISLMYFSGLSLLVFSLIVLGENLALPYLITAISFPITIYSIYYQAVTVKKWCLLCLCVVVVLWTQTLFAALNFELISAFSFSIQSILFTVLSFISVFTIWNFLLPITKNLHDLKNTKVEYYKFKRNFNLFNTLLEQSKTIDTTIVDASEIIFGNINAKLQITVITNPFCGHCKPVHNLVENILKKYFEKVNIVIRFSVNNTDAENSLVKITSRLIELYNTDGTESCLKAMHHIYNGQEPKLWFEEFGTCNNKALYIKTLESQGKWCTNNAINFTPEILINGRSYPKEYDRSDLIYFIEDLVEKQQTQNIETKKEHSVNYAQ